MPRILGIDYGTKRIGLAISDEDFNMAFPAEAVPNNWEDFKEKLLEMIEIEEISQIVLGLPIGLRDKKQNPQKKFGNFAKKSSANSNCPLFLKMKFFPRRKF